MSGSGRDKHDGPLASVHSIDPSRPKWRRRRPPPQAALTDEASAPDRNAALTMLSTFDLADVDVRSADEILATLVPRPAANGAANPPKGSPIDRQADDVAVEDAKSDEILRDLEEHHRRGLPSARPSAPRGSAELQPIPRRSASPARERQTRSRAAGESKPRTMRARIVFPVAAAVVLAASVSAVMLSQLSGTGGRPTTPAGSGRLTASIALTLAPAKIVDSVTKVVASEEREFARRVTSSAELRLGTVRVRHRQVSHASVQPAPSTSPVTFIQSSGSSSAPASGSQPATSTTATAPSGSHQSQPAFGLNGSLGPGRGAAGTQ
jgi:hypothetical protein